MSDQFETDDPFRLSAFRESVDHDAETPRPRDTSGRSLPTGPLYVSPISDYERDLLRWADDGGPCID